MAETVESPAAGQDPAAEDTGFYHESAINATWTGTRLAIGGLAFLFGAFVFAYFYLRSLNSEGRWHGPGYHPPSLIWGTVIMILVLVSAGVHYAGLQQIKAGHKKLWQIAGLVALVMGLVAVALQISELLYLPFWPGSSGFSSVFVGVLPGIPDHCAGRDGMAGDPARQVAVHPRDLLRRAAADLRACLRRPALPGVAELLRPHLELPGGHGPIVLVLVLRDLKCT